MRKCSVINCGFKRDGTGALDGLHRMPKCEMKRKKWIESIGVNNINLSHKNIFICSLHFDKSCFSKETNNVTLLSNAVPSPVVFPRVLLPSSNTSIMSNNTDEEDDCETSNSESGEPCYSKIPPDRKPIISKLTQERMNSQRIIKRLKEKNDEKQLTIKRLKEQIRRQTKKIANLTDTVATLRKQFKSDHIIILEECDFEK